MEESSEYEFYLDPDTDESVLAISKESKGRRVDGLIEGFAATFDRPNSSVSWTAIDPSMLGEPIPEEKARELHPRLFDRLDRAEQ